MMSMTEMCSPKLMADYQLIIRDFYFFNGWINRYTVFVVVQKGLN